MAPRAPAMQGRASPSTSAVRRLSGKHVEHPRFHFSSIAPSLGERPPTARHCMAGDIGMASKIAFSGPKAT